MNKQEVIEKVKTLKPDEQNLHEYQPEEWEAFKDGFDDAKCYAELAVEKLEEPEKPVLSKDEAEWVDKLKEFFITRCSYGDYSFAFSMCGKTYKLPIKEGINHEELNSIRERLVNALLYGYEVEKEKLYTVKFSNNNLDTTYIGIIKSANKIGLSTLPRDDEFAKCYFTESELKELKFWDNPAFETEEVEE